MAKRIGIDGALKQARAEMSGKGGPEGDALRSKYQAPSALPAAVTAVNTLADKDLWGEGGPAESTRTLSPEDREFFAERRAARKLSRARNMELRELHQELIAAGRHAEAAELLASVATVKRYRDMPRRDIPEYMPADEGPSGESVSLPWDEPGVDVQRERFESAKTGRLGQAMRDYANTSTLGMLPSAGVTAALAPNALPQFTEPVRDRYWRSDVGRANTMPVRTGRVPISATLRSLANARAIARETSKKVVPLGAGAGVAAAGAGALGAALAAPALMAAPAYFVGGDGPGSFAETQTLKGQIDALARYKGGPLDIRDLKPEVFEELAVEQGVAAALIQSGALSDESIEELGYWQGRARERDEAGEIARLRALGMLDSEDDDVVRDAMGATAWKPQLYVESGEVMPPDDMTWEALDAIRKGEIGVQPAISDLQRERQGMALDMLVPFESGEIGIQPAISEIQRERQMAEDAPPNPAGFDAWSERVRRPYGSE